jgi:hypothetical protein
LPKRTALPIALATPVQAVAPVPQVMYGAGRSLGVPPSPPREPSGAPQVSAMEPELVPPKGPSAHELAGCWCNVSPVPFLSLGFGYHIRAEDDDTIAIVAAGIFMGLPVVVCGEYQRGQSIELELEAETRRRVVSSRYMRTERSCMMMEEFLDPKDSRFMKSNISAGPWGHFFRIC